jgi:hypothetical protein
MSARLLSVVLCTHNPRADFLARTLAALRAQTLPPSAWEFILIDNTSTPPVATAHDLSGFPAARVVVEPALGLTPARLRGIAEAAAPLLVFVDDDNLLSPDYLHTALRLGRDHPMLGAWGCGDFTPEWEEPPAPDLAPFLTYLAVHRTPRDRWSNQLYDYAATPAGAGLCVCRAVAQRYAALVRADPRRQGLDRTGGQLTGCGDFDLALTAIDLGLGTGVFTALRLTHLMPRGRVQRDYLLRLAEGHAYSSVFLHSFRGQPAPLARGLLARLRHWRYLCTLTPAQRALQAALTRGETRAHATLAATRPG